MNVLLVIKKFECNAQDYDGMNTAGAAKSTDYQSDWWIMVRKIRSDASKVMLAG